MSRPAASTLVCVSLMAWAALAEVEAAPFAFAPNDNRDDTRGVQQYLDLLKEPSTPVRPPLPAGKLLISDTLKVHTTMGYRLAGSGGQNRSPSPGWDRVRVGTILVWKGPPDKPILEIAGCTGMVIQGVNFDGNASAGILIRHGGGSLNIAIRDCGFMHQAVGIQCGTSYTESTCANITYDNCHFRGHSQACVRIVSRQSVEHLFLRPQFTFSATGIDVQAGGIVSVLGGGTYELDTFLRLGRIGSNTRGFRVQSLRFDGTQDSKRTAWLAFADPRRARTYGAITFENCSQTHSQQHHELPLVTVAPGSRVVLRECSFTSKSLIGGNLAHIHSDRRAGGELVAENCDGLHGQRLAEYVEAKGSRAYYTFLRCGDLYTETGSVTNAALPAAQEIAENRGASTE